MIPDAASSSRIVLSRGSFFSSMSRRPHSFYPRTDYTTYDMESAEDELGALIEFRGTKAAGAKAVADSMKKAAATMENFMVVTLIQRHGSATM